jgi:hypothetical protein
MPNDKQHQNSDYWYGKNIVCQGRLIYLYDHRYNDPEWKGAVTLSNGNVTRSNVADFFNFREVALPSGSDPVYAKHAVIHHDNPNTLYDNNIDNELVVLRVSTTPSVQGGPKCFPGGGSEPKVVQFAMTDGSSFRRDDEKWVTEFLTLTFDQAKKLSALSVRSQAHEFEEGFAHFLDIILPGRVENLLAFRLLCEASKFVTESKAKKSKDYDAASHSCKQDGITIHAPGDTPEKLGEWLTPFGKSKPEEISQVAALIGSGEVKTAAENVLNAVHKSGDLQGAIDKYLKLIAKQS